MGKAVKQRRLRRVKYLARLADEEPERFERERENGIVKAVLNETPKKASIKVGDKSGDMRNHQEKIGGEHRKMNVIIQFCREISSGLSLCPPGQAPIKDSRFRFVTPKDIDGTELGDDLVQLYRNIFGDRDTWGEGAYCQSEGWDKMIDIKEYDRRLATNNALCECGSPLLPCHPPDYIKSRILDEMSAKPDTFPACLLMVDEHEIVGFTWGATIKVANIPKRLVRARYPGREDIGEKDAHSLMERLSECGLSKRKYVLYIDELAVHKSQRKGLSHVQFLARGLCEHALNKTNHAIFWTSERSPIYDVTILCGFVPIYETSNGIVFMYLEDFKPLLVLSQNKTPLEMQELFIQLAKRICS